MCGVCVVCVCVREGGGVFLSEYERWSSFPVSFINSKSANYVISKRHRQAVTQTDRQTECVE